MIARARTSRCVDALHTDHGIDRTSSTRKFVFIKAIHSSSVSDGAADREFVNPSSSTFQASRR